MVYLPLFCCCFFVAIFSTIRQFMLTHTGFVLFDNIATTSRVFYFFKQDKAKQELHFVLSENQVNPLGLEKTNRPRRCVLGLFCIRRIVFLKQWLEDQLNRNRRRRWVEEESTQEMDRTGIEAKDRVSLFCCFIGKQKQRNDKVK